MNGTLEHPNAIGWTTVTWSPACGCYHDCPYCYARTIAERFRGSKAFPNGFEPTWHPERLDEPVRAKKPMRIFVGSMTDMMGLWWKRMQIESVIKMCRATPRHLYLWLTKNPLRYKEFSWPDNVMLGVTITGDDEPNRKRLLEFIEGANLVNIRQHKKIKCFVSLEPMLGPAPEKLLYYTDWLIIGALTGDNPKQPEKKWVDDVLAKADELHVPVWLKSNLDWSIPRQELPVGVPLGPKDPPQKWASA